MAQAGREIVYPTFEQVCSVNRRMIEKYGGDFNPPTNTQNPDALKYILEAIANPIYGRDLYPSLKEKAAGIAHHIISRHVFQNGNKRTGTHMAWEFLRANGHHVTLEEGIIELTEAIATGTSGYEQFLQWLRDHQEN